MKKFKYCIVAICWIIIWQVANLLIKDAFPFAGPIEVIVRMYELMRTGAFWLAIFTTFSGLILGFVVACITGTVLGYISYYNEHVEVFISPMMGFFRYIPMISFTILMLIWNSSALIAFEVSVFLSLPVIYRHTLLGLRHSTDKILHQIWKHKMPLRIKLDLIYRPATMPEYMVGCHRAINMCCKSGIIAQFLGDAAHSIGKSLSEVSANVDIAGIFAWTVVIVALSIGLERILIRLLSMTWINEKKIDVDEIIASIDEAEDIYL